MAENGKAEFDPDTAAAAAPEAAAPEEEARWDR